MIAALKRAAHKSLSPWLYRNPEPQLQTDRLYLYLDTLYKTRDVPGAIVEVGCFQGGTATYAFRFLKRINCEREYLCVDTFSGFPQDQFEEDVKLGTSNALAKGFSGNSQAFVRKLLDQWDCPSIKLLEADIVALEAARLPDKIAVALIDVDIAKPTEAALLKILPKMSAGGIILVDDCDQIPFKGARQATEKIAPKAEYRFGMGIISNHNCVAG